VAEEARVSTLCTAVGCATGGGWQMSADSSSTSTAPDCSRYRRNSAFGICCFWLCRDGQHPRSCQSDHRLRFSVYKPAADFYSVLLPTYEEYDNIGIIVWLLVKHFEEAGLAFEIIIIGALPVRECPVGRRPPVE
jgi:hypothetical protein